MQATSVIPDPRAPLPYPNGWFMLCRDSDIKRGKVSVVAFMGRELVLYRTETGQVHAVTPYCPHLGAHIGRGGWVEGENLVCPFHGFVYGPDGRCLRTGTGKQPPRMSLGQVPIQEAYGLLFTWHDHVGASPKWELPQLDPTGYCRAFYGGNSVHGYVQDLIENMVDAGHLSYVHKLGASYSFTTPEMDGHMLKTKLSDYLNLGIKLDLTGHGLGLMVAQGGRPDLGLELQIVVAMSPRAPMHWDLIHMSRFRISRPRMVPASIRNVVSVVLSKACEMWTAYLNKDDIPIWSSRTYQEHPMLTKEDLPFVIFRRWSKQFYPPMPAAAPRRELQAAPSAERLV